MIMCRPFAQNSSLTSPGLYTGDITPETSDTNHQSALFELEQKKGRNIDLPDKVECFNQKLKESEGPVV